MKVGYARARKDEVLETEGYATILQVPKVFVDRYNQRTQWQELLLYVEKGDTVVVQDLKELSSVPEELFEMVQVLAVKGVYLESLNDNISLADQPVGEAMMAIFSLMGQLNGKDNEFYQSGANYQTSGYRRDHSPDIDWDRFDYLYPRYKAGEITKIEMYKDLGITRQQLNKILEEIEKSDK